MRRKIIVVLLVLFVFLLLIFSGPVFGQSSTVEVIGYGYGYGGAR